MTTIIYIAGPMSGMPEYNFPAFHDAEARLVAGGYEVRNPVHTPPPPWLDDHSDDPDAWRYYMREAIRLLLEANAICLLPGWEKSRGARLELRIALALKMPVMIAAGDHFEVATASQIEEVMLAHG